MDEMELISMPIPGPAPDSAEVRWYRARLKRCPEKKLMAREARERRKAWVRGRGHHDRWMSAVLLQQGMMRAAPESVNRLSIVSAIEEELGCSVALTTQGPGAVVATVPAWVPEDRIEDRIAATVARLRDRLPLAIDVSIEKRGAEVTEDNK